jgi:hypothetical protein
MKASFSTKLMTRFFLPVMILCIGEAVHAQNAPPTLPDTSKMTYNQISHGLKLVVFPSKGQSQQQQKIDEFECYKWSIEQTGIDPLNLPKVEAAPAQSSSAGSGAKSAARGAAAGLAIGSISGNAGEGAAVGAAAGAVAGRRRAKQADAQQAQQSQADVAKKENEIKASFIKGFSACMEGKGYSLK